MNRNILIVYYTKTLNTQKVAEAICRNVGGTLLRIMPVTPYPKSYNMVVKQAKKEIAEGYLPTLKTKVDNIESYDTIFIGSPNWWSTVAPPVNTFLSENNLKEKTIVPFLTHGGGGLGHTEGDLRKICKESDVMSMFSVYGSGGSGLDDAISDWLKKIGF